MTGVSIEVEGSTLTLTIDFFDEAGDRIYNSLVSAIVDAIVELKNLVVTGYLSGQVLKQVSGKLASSINVDIDEDLEGITGKVVQEFHIAPYGYVHEHGGVFEIPEHLRKLKSGEAAVVRSHSATYPRRSFMQAALDKSARGIYDKLLKAVEGAIR